MKFLLKTFDRRDRKPNFVIFVVWNALIVSEWVVLAWSRKSYLKPAEIASYLLLASFKDGRRRVSPRLHLLVLDVNQGNVEAG